MAKCRDRKRAFSPWGVQSVTSTVPHTASASSASCCDSQSSATRVSASVKASQRAPSASSALAPVARAKPTLRASTSSTRAPDRAAIEAVASLQRSATTTISTRSPPRAGSRAQALARARQGPINISSLCAGMTIPIMVLLQKASVEATRNWRNHRCATGAHQFFGGSFSRSKWRSGMAAMKAAIAASASVASARTSPASAEPSGSASGI